MTRLFTLLILISSSWIGTLAQNAQSDEVRGTYWNAEKTSHIRIYRAKNGKYYGKIEYLKEPNDENGNPKTDPENPDKELRSRSRLGMVIMNSFSWNESE